MRATRVTRVRRRPATGRRASGRGVATLLLAALGLLVLAATAGRSAAGSVRTVTDPAAADPSAALLVLVTAGIALVAAWLGLGLLACLVAALPGAAGDAAARCADLVAPAAVRRLAGALLGGALLAGGLAPTALAAPGTPGSPGAGGAVAVVATQVGGDPQSWSERVAAAALSPDLAPTSAARAPATSAPAAPVTSTGTTTAPATRVGLGALAPAPTRPALAVADVVVHPGDCLWDIAAAHLPAGADDARVASATRAWYAANRVVVGADPDHIRPGQVLRAPDQAGGQ